MSPFAQVRLAVVVSCLCLTAVAASSAKPALQSLSTLPAVFPVAPHPDALIEWWYANARVRSAHGRRLAVVCAFFKFGGDQMVIPGLPARTPSHYLIYSVTDLDRKSQRSYSLADSSMLAGLKALLMLTGASDPRSTAFARALLAGNVPKPHQKITGNVVVRSDPFSVQYGNAGTLESLNTNHTRLSLSLNGGRDTVALTFESAKPVMAVGGTGQTGLSNPTDMYYYSMTRCSVVGQIDTGEGSDHVDGDGWVDHQWGSSWTTQSAGWDWWGVQLDNGDDFLMFQQRDLATGKTFFPLATLMDSRGRLTVIHDVTFRPDKASIWESSHSGVSYPLAWHVDLPRQGLALRIRADVQDQEMPILSPGGDIWEGSCHVDGAYANGSASAGHGAGIGAVTGNAYMELVDTAIRRP